ncbi:MAG: SH3 domain-containing protein [Planctomycetota bacterium]
MITLVLLAVLQWSDAPAARAAGDAAYRAQRYADAEGAYRAALELGGPRGILQYDLGACAFRAKQMGRALYHFRLAQVRLPRDQEVKDNLSSVQRRLGKGETQAFQFTRSLKAAMHWLTMGEVLIVGYAALLLALVMAALFVLTGRRGARRLLVLGASVVLLAAGLLWMRGNEPDQGVSLASRTTVHNEPSAQTESIFTLAEGEEVLVREVRDQWAKIENDKGARGWVPLDRIGVVELQDLGGASSGS